ncbi:hypothetical protein PMPD1_4364 (plasmid) [Paramixta manurensis]|uniref:Apea-like HEPN domain-containing protein n=1 Tax=Paramixta manurensis TaxID=2740817 RepID=A0A6M8UQW0_9GAMM|nr:hypothetical protein PMPD1_4364 [Erwiniaceae bacterium PD-1]
MTTTIPDEFIAAFNRVWLLPAGMDHNAILNSHEFLHLRNTSDKHCHAQIEGNFFDPFLLRGLHKLGVPCFFTAGSPLAAADMSETAAQCYGALMKRHEQHIYLCPLDCAGCIPQIETANWSIRRFSKNELDELLNSLPLQRVPGNVSADTARLSQFLWLVVRHVEEMRADFAERYWPWNANRDHPGAVSPYKFIHPEAVESAIFSLMLAPWEEWQHNEEYYWRPFNIPWVHTLSDDIFRQQLPIPSAATLSWVLCSYHDENVGWDEYEAPHEYAYSVTCDQLMPFFDPQFCNQLEAAVTSGLINVAARHQFVKAFMSDGVDEFLAHVVVIDACIGETSADKAMEKHLRRLQSTGRLKYRLAGLLNDASVKESMNVIYNARSDYVHGNALEEIPGEHILQARSLAQKTLNAIVTEAGRSPGLVREAFLDDILRRGWNLIESGCS